ncbi:hypothetical protein K435DRAFT_937727 [Dendrothele bispora CBS 962.96]|uniref:Uncharacterized protein n=1 Tax=Dendrothele bispora (strain CBS 962.96) TaxID=1314807 RepID=A0A4S8MBU6_DENBC|nr:hypothetical protein K435DRAFT_937727 [Dendrothele bispora CBS 962.96]
MSDPLWLMGETTFEAEDLLQQTYSSDPTTHKITSHIKPTAQILPLVLDYTAFVCTKATSNNISRAPYEFCASSSTPESESESPSNSGPDLILMLYTDLYLLANNCQQCTLLSGSPTRTLGSYHQIPVLAFEVDRPTTRVDNIYSLHPTISINILPLALEVNSLRRKYTTGLYLQLTFYHQSFLSRVNGPPTRADHTYSLLLLPVFQVDCPPIRPR